MIDRRLNYGRHNIERYLKDAMPYATVLDLGAGKGDDLMIAKRVGEIGGRQLRLCAIESFPPNVELLKSQGIEVFNCDLERDRFPFEDESVDIILTNQVMEHLKDVFWTLHETTRILKVGGHFIVGVPNLAAFHNRILLSMGKQPSTIKNNSAHVRAYTKNDFRNLVNSGFDGYRLQNFKGSNLYPFPPALALPLSKMFPTLSVGIFFDFVKIRSYTNDGYLKWPIEQELETKFFLGGEA